MRHKRFSAEYSRQPLGWQYPLQRPSWRVKPSRFHETASGMFHKLRRRYVGFSNSLVNLDKLTKSAERLTREVSEAMGGIFAPYQIKRLAKADTGAALIEMQSQIEIKDVHRRAVRRWVEEEAQRQENMGDITAGALPRLNENATAGSVEDDWIVNFFDNSRIVSDKQMQGLDVGHTTLARIDRELAPICEGKPVDRFCKCVNDRWKKYVPKSEAE